MRFASIAAFAALTFSLVGCMDGGMTTGASESDSALQACMATGCTQDVCDANNNECVVDATGTPVPTVAPTATPVVETPTQPPSGLCTDGTLPKVWWIDGDKDGYGNGTVITGLNPMQTCQQPAGYVSNNTDCNDYNASVHPGATDICNGLDDDCDGLVDGGQVHPTWWQDGDGDGYGDGDKPTVMACAQPDGYVSNDTDCNDYDADVHPGATEICDGQDNDCDGLVDEGFTHQNWYVDADGDGYGNGAKPSQQACSQPVGYVNNATDCDDYNAARHPGATEIDNGIDDNCNGQIDEGFESSTPTPGPTPTPTPGPTSTPSPLALCGTTGFTFYGVSEWTSTDKVMFFANVTCDCGDRATQLGDLVYKSGWSCWHATGTSSSWQASWGSCPASTQTGYVTGWGTACWE